MRVLPTIAAICFSAIAGATAPSAQTKSCFDQWYAVRQQELSGVQLTGRAAANAYTPSVLSREDIATCEASKDKKFRRIKSRGER